MSVASGTRLEPPPAGYRRLRRELARTMSRTIAEHGLVAEGDRILVAVSGGKDSLTLLDLLWRARRRAPVRFEIVAFHLDQAQPGYDGRALRAFLEEMEVPFEIAREDTYSIVQERTVPGATACRVCSRLRRGVLYTRAAKLGCNKLALGHHRDDALETLLMNLFYSGRLQAMPARYRRFDSSLEVIRPLIDCAEEAIARHAAGAGYPILPCNLCGSQDDLKRDRMARLLAGLEREIPDVRSVMMAALRNVRPTHLLDREVAEAWEAAASRYAPRR